MLNFVAPIVSSVGDLQQCDGKLQLSILSPYLCYPLRHWLSQKICCFH